MQQENKLRYCARATNVRFFTRNTLSRFLTLKHMLATEAQRELEKCTLCSIDQTTAMLCSSGSKALTLVSLVLLVRLPPPTWFMTSLALHTHTWVIWHEKERHTLRRPSWPGLAAVLDHCREPKVKHQDLRAMACECKGCLVDG